MMSQIVIEYNNVSHIHHIITHHTKEYKRSQNNDVILYVNNM